MTAVEWLIEQIKEYDFTPPSNNEEYVIVMPKWIFDAKRDEAKEMEKQQIIDAYNKSFELRDKPYSTADKYYTSTYGSNGSDETKYYEQSRGINIDSFQSEAPKKQDYIVKVTDATSSQTEISNEEIRIESMARFIPVSYQECFEEGVKWYREQLKSRQ